MTYKAPYGQTHVCICMYVCFITPNGLSDHLIRVSFNNLILKPEVITHLRLECLNFGEAFLTLSGQLNLWSVSRHC